MGKEKSSIQLNVYNLRGQKVKTLFEGTLESGIHNLIWDATDDNGRKVASGTIIVNCTQPGNLNCSNF
jgi:flagellar hook assembly protein FlgD